MKLGLYQCNIIHFVLEKMKRGLDRLVWRFLIQFFNTFENRIKFELNFIGEGELNKLLRVKRRIFERCKQMIDLSNTEVDLAKSNRYKDIATADVSLSFSLPVNSRVINLPHPF